MALSAHLNELNNKHIKLDEKIRSELKHPMPDTLRLAALKKQKLQIKEKIIHYRSD
jgi:hypothetical protein